MLNIVIPMAGRGSRFSEAGYKNPKPLIQVHGVPMIKIVVDNLTPVDHAHRFIFICQRAHSDEFGLRKFLPSICAKSEVIEIDEVTDGQLCTVLKARELIDNNDPVMTANSDQYIDFDINLYLEQIKRKALDGSMMTMFADDPKWSYAKHNNGLISETAEKQVISDQATVGIYNFTKGADLVRSADKMIADDVRVNGEFYVCPVFNYMIAEGAKIGFQNIGYEGNGMYGLGIPKDLEFFRGHDVSLKAVQKL